MTFISTIALSILASGLYVSGAVLSSNINIEAPAELVEVCNDKSDAVPFYRSFQPFIVDHFYTTNYAEHQNAITNLGYKDEGISGYIFPSQVPYSVPFYRSFNRAGGDHFYTTSAAERDSADRGGWAYEGIAGYVYPDNSCGTIPFYRLYNNAAGDHFYTTSVTERDNAHKNVGYVEEGIAAYIFATSELSSSGWFMPSFMISRAGVEELVRKISKFF